MFKNIFLALALIFSVVSHSSDKGVEAFHKRFELVKKDGKVTQILDRTIFGKFELAPYIKFIKEALKEEQKRMMNKGVWEKEVYDLIVEENMGQKGLAEEQAPIVIDALQELSKLDIDAIFDNPQFKKVLGHFESQISLALAKIGVNVIAKLDDPTFFYKRHLTYEALKMSLQFAKRMLSTVPLLNTASYVLVEAERLVRERRHFHQNLAMHYFQKIKPEQLKMTHDEVSYSWSSIYESRIPWYAFWESEEAKSNWKKFGPNRFYFYFRTATNRLRSNRSTYSNVGDRVNFAFNNVSFEKQGKAIVNLFDTEHMFTMKPGVAFYYDEPQKILRKRLIFSLAELGISFLPLPQWMKDISESFIKSNYANQKITEGSLFAHFEIQQNSEMKMRILAQGLNPFERDFDKSYQFLKSE